MNENPIADNQQTQPQPPQQPQPQPWSQPQTQPQPQPDTSTNPTQPPTPQPFQPPVAAYGITTQPGSKKKSLLWLWITLGTVIVISIATVVTVLVAKSNADAAAKEYKSSAKTYLDEVYDTAIGSGDSPSDILDDMKKIEAPALKKAFLGQLSKSYEESKKQQNTINDTVSKATNTINDVSEFKESVDTVIALTLSLIDNESTLSSSIQYGNQASFKTSLDAMAADCTELEKTITNMKKLDDISDHIATLGTDVVALCDSIDDITAAYDQQSNTALINAIRAYSDEGYIYNSSYATIKTDAENAGDIVKEAAKPLQKLSDSL